jgi:hypothetical protein
MDAFNKVPLRMRERLASLTGGQTRLLGGSVDTLYIPNRLRKDFMEVLALFLETECFMEIATPTAVHLVLPHQEQILFVDHVCQQSLELYLLILIYPQWWSWQPPFNVTFVRQKWAQGFEVDTFHRFHWGNEGPDGLWRGNHGNIEDVRLLLQESAERQQVKLL